MSAGRSPGNKITIFRGDFMTVTFEYKVLEGSVPVVEQYTDIKMCNYYFTYGRTYLKLYKNNSEFKYDFCIDLSDVKEFLIKN